MKTLVLILIIASMAAVSGLWLARRNSQSTNRDTAETKADSNEVAATVAVASGGEAPINVPPARRSEDAAPQASAPVRADSAGSSASLPYQQALGTLISPQSSFAQKQSAWQQVRAAGKLDQVITDLEQRAAAEPTVAEYPAVLGQACLQKAGTLSDIREQGILGMKADQCFDAALNLDPSNWEAGFWKAAALSYWPPQLGKGKEVIERFVALAKLQEGLQPQPQFAQTYLMLGEQYQKQGYPEYAKQTWERGAVLFPSERAFTTKLSEPAPQQGQ